jgi:hypothetical protein
MTRIVSGDYVISPRRTAASISCPGRLGKRSRRFAADVAAPSCMDCGASHIAAPAIKTRGHEEDDAHAAIGFDALVFFVRGAPQRSRAESISHCNGLMLSVTICSLENSDKASASPEPRGPYLPSSCTPTTARPCARAATASAESCVATVSSSRVISFHSSAVAKWIASRVPSSVGIG